MATVLPCRAVSSAELPVLQSMCQAIIKEQQPFERLEVSTEVLLDLFKVITGDLSSDSTPLL